ncbi:MAG: hypothetical protein KatS3mg102_2675 [Planctomycetota bacterium]|nr:MAG: hypothetical protein KatS3mg102_2675 [Planctomycetota bacterium]
MLPRVALGASVFAAAGALALGLALPVSGGGQDCEFCGGGPRPKLPPIHERGVVQFTDSNSGKCHFAAAAAKRALSGGGVAEVASDGGSNGAIAPCGGGPGPKPPGPPVITTTFEVTYVGS